MLPALLGKPLPETTVVSQRAYGNGHHLALTDGDLRLHARFTDVPTGSDARYELYNIATDRIEQQNIMSTFIREVETMKQLLSRTWMDSLRLNRTLYEQASSKVAQLSDEEKRRLKSLGYMAD